jgi:hypothetical protein
LSPQAWKRFEGRPEEFKKSLRKIARTAARSLRGAG